MSCLKIKQSLLVTLGIAAFGVAGVLAGCSGGDTGPDNSDAGTRDGYVSDGGSGATLTIRLADDSDELNVADTKGFYVEALDPRGAPLEYIRIFCESERGIAIIEPSANGIAFEHTGPDGLMSGKLGGLLPGSFLLECRAPEGYGLIARARLHVRGTVPADFGGFPGAAGGNLGGGVIVNDNNADQASILSVLFTDAGGESPAGPFDVLPVSPTDCDGDATTLDPELFTDVNYAITINNTFNQPITIDSVEFLTGGAAGASSGELGVVATIPADSEGTFQGLYVTFNETSQVFTGTSTAVTIGTFPVTITVNATTASGDEIEITDTVTVSFRNVNNCQ